MEHCKTCKNGCRYFRADRAIGEYDGECSNQRAIVGFFNDEGCVEHYFDSENGQLVQATSVFDVFELNEQECKFYESR